MKNYLSPISKKCQNKIYNQMNFSFYDIKISKEKYEIGFFSFIKYNNKKIPVIIMSDDQKNEEKFNSIEVMMNNKKEIITLEKTRYRNKDCNIMVIEIKEAQKDKLNFIEIDDNLFINKLENYHKESIYIIQNDSTKNSYVSYGLITGINKSEIRFNGNIISEMKLYIFFNVFSNKIFGIKPTNSTNNRGILLTSIINAFIKEYIKNDYLQNFELNKRYKSYQIKTNEIDIYINIGENDIYKNIYFLDNYEEKNGKYLHNKFNELSSSKVDLFINEDKKEFQKYFVPVEKGEYKIKLKFNFNLTDCSYMFAGCKNIIRINFNSFNTNNVSNMKCMFYECENIKNINIFSSNTKNVKDMSYMFFNCRNLINLDLSSFDISKVVNLSFMFSYCNNLKQLFFPIINVISDKINYNYIFFGCNNLKNIDLSLYNNINKKFINEIEPDIKNEIDIKIKVYNNDIDKEIYFLDNYEEKNGEHLHNKFNELNEMNTELFINDEKTKYNKYFIPKNEGDYNIKLKFDINLSNCSYMFAGCNNIKSVNFISFNTKYITYMRYMFYECESLNGTIILSNFNTKNVIDMSYMFFGCTNLVTIDLSSFNIDKVADMSFMFSYSYFLKKLIFPSITKKKEDVKINYILYGCNKLNNNDLSFFKNIYKELTVDVDPTLKNEVDITLKISKKDINKEIYFLDNLGSPNYKNYHTKFNELNQSNTELSINNKKREFRKYIKPKSEGEYKVKLKFYINLTDCSYMFSGCKNIVNIDFIYFNTKYIRNMSCMFYQCDNLTSLDLSSFNTRNLINMDSMFAYCSSLLSLDLSSFYIKKETQYWRMFSKCSSLKKENIIIHDESLLNNFNTK